MNHELEATTSRNDCNCKVEVSVSDISKSIMGRAMTFNPTPEQIEAAAIALWNISPITEPGVGVLSYAESGRAFKARARADLVAAAGAAPQEPKDDFPASGKHAAQLQVDEAKLADVLDMHVLGKPNGGTASWAWLNCSCGHRVEIAGVTREYVVEEGRRHQAREVAEWLRGGAQ